MREKIFKIFYQGEAEERLDKILAAELEGYSRSRLQKLIEKGNVLVDGHLVQKKSVNIVPGAEINVRIPPPKTSEIIPEKIALDIIFENEDVLVINKPAGMVVHPSAGHSSGTLVHAALAHAPEIEGVGGVKRPGVVHRLDKDTSGVILMAKNDKSHIFLQNQFQERTVEKEYLALVDGKPPTPKGRIEIAIGRDFTNRQRMAPVFIKDGKEAISEYYTLEEFTNHTLLKVHILTGRTHQIRVHLAHLKCPVVGDTTYGRNNPSLPVKRQFLHAAHITIIIPGETEPRTFKAALPPDLTQVLEELR
ncbi:MAG: RluA family pseudouridine synthase [Chloroflexota bacterium]|nr:RluA family pseudouridine synthase [Chloroflexota bacterium]